MASKELTNLVQAQTQSFLQHNCQLWGNLSEKVAAELTPLVAEAVEKVILASIAESYADPRIVALKEIAAEALAELEKQVQREEDYDGFRDVLCRQLREKMDDVPGTAQAAGPGPRVSLHQLAALRNAGRLALSLIDGIDCADNPHYDRWQEAARLLRAALGEVPHA